MRKYALIMFVFAILASLVVMVPPAQAQEEPTQIDETKVYQEEDYALFGLDEPGIEPGYDLQYRKLPSTPGGKPTVACTWDDGSSAVTHYVLDVLDRFPNVHCTFFVNGREAVPGTFQRILDSGHAIASHGINHLALTGRSCSSIRQQILAIEPFVNARIDEPVAIKAYRPPYGSTNDSVRNCMEGVGYSEWLWSVDTRDWTYPGVSYILRELNSMVDGDIVLQHDSASKQDSVRAFELFLEDRHGDYNFVLIPGAGFHNPCETGSFTDVCVDDTFFNAIEWLKASGITAGCNADGSRFCPNDNVTRGQMAAFLTRGLALSSGNTDYFIDDNGSIFESSINRLFEAGITNGCNPNSGGDRFCPDGLVTRGQMAAFLVRALGLPAYDGPNRFNDDDGNMFEDAIERLAQAGITLGCNPPDNTEFCPDGKVTRSQMAAFLARALG